MRGAVCDMYAHASYLIAVPAQFLVWGRYEFHPFPGGSSSGFDAGSGAGVTTEGFSTGVFSKNCVPNQYNKPASIALPNAMSK